MKITQDMLLRMTLGRGNIQNMASVVKGLDQMAVAAELDRPHRLAHYIAQLMHESAFFRYDRELWDGKGAQARYDTRTDLGNTPEVDGDGFKFRGRTPIQITGKSNYQQFRDWVWQFDRTAPDFVENPDAANTDPWEGYGPIWYWTTRRLNALADRNDIEMITRRINGGLNGYSDRLEQYTHAALVLLGYPPDDVMAFQQSVMITADGISGPITRGKLHEALMALEATPAFAGPAPSLPRDASAAPPPPAQSRVVSIPQEVHDLIEETSGEGSWTKRLNTFLKYLGEFGIGVPALLAFIGDLDPIVAGAIVVAAGAVLGVSIYVNNSRDRKAQKAFKAKVAIESAT